jgi:hypothetical protein
MTSGVKYAHPPQQSLLDLRLFDRLAVPISFTQVNCPLYKSGTLLSEGSGYVDRRTPVISRSLRWQFNPTIKGRPTFSLALPHSWASRLRLNRGRNGVPSSIPSCHFWCVCMLFIHGIWLSRSTGTVILFSLIVVGLAAHLTFTTISTDGVYFIFAAMCLASAGLTLLTVPVMYVYSYLLHIS